MFRTPSVDRRVKSIPVYNTRVLETQMPKELPMYQYQETFHRNGSSENKPTENITKTELIHSQNLKQTGRTPQILESHKRKYPNQNAVLIQARLGLHKTRMATNSKSKDDYKTMSSIDQTFLRIEKNKHLLVVERDAQSKPQATKSQVGNRISSLTNRLRNPPKFNNTFNPSEISKTPVSHDKEGSVLLNPKKKEKTNLPKQSESFSSSKAPPCSAEMLCCTDSVFLQHELDKNYVDLSMNYNPLLGLKTNRNKSSESYLHSKPQFTASETVSHSTTPGQSNQSNSVRFPLKNESPAESNQLGRIFTPELDIVNNTLHYNQSACLPLKTRTCKHMINGAGSSSENNHTYFISSHAVKKDQTKKGFIQTADNSAKSLNSNYTASGRHILCKTDAIVKQAAVIQQDSNRLPPTMANLFTHYDEQKPRSSFHLNPQQVAAFLTETDYSAYKACNPSIKEEEYKESLQVLKNNHFNQSQQQEDKPWKSPGLQKKHKTVSHHGMYASLGEHKLILIKQFE